MKTKLTLAALIAATGVALNGQIQINENLSVGGFIDTSYVHGSSEVADVDETDNSFTVDQVEINWYLTFGDVSGVIDMQYTPDGTDNFNLERAEITYDLGGGSAITAGRLQSLLGFEAFEPTGLYQYSFAYTGFVVGEELAALGFVLPAPYLPGYNDGVRYTYSDETTFFAVSLQDGIFSDDDRLGGDDSSDWGIEAAGSYSADGLTYFLGGFYEGGEDAFDTDLEFWGLNTYFSYEFDAWVTALELNYGEQDYEDNFDDEVFAALLMANFAYSDQGSITGRISYVDSNTDYETLIDDVSTTNGVITENESDYFKFTVAHGWAFTDNLLLVSELSWIEGENEATSIVDDSTTDTDYSEGTFAMELLFTF
ncbi:MAG: outer membrane beta-barrel protein [Verrucomicrobiota bacterium]